MSKEEESAADKRKPTTNLYSLLYHSDQEFHEYVDQNDRRTTVHTNSDLETSGIKDGRISNINNASDQAKTSVTTAVEGEESQKRPLLKRLFTKMEAGSLRGSIFGMVSLSIGSGALSLPRVCNNMSFLLGCIMITISAMCAYWTLNLMIAASKSKGVYNYSKLVETVLGRWAALALNIVILIYSIGVIISYEVTIYKLLGSFIYDIFYSTDYKDLDTFLAEVWSASYLRVAVLYGVNAVVVIPLCLIKDLSKMRIVSLIGITCMLYVIIVIIVQAPFFISENIKKDVYSDDRVNWYDLGSGFRIESLWFFKGTAVFFFAYTCHLGVFPIYLTLKNNIIRRVNKVFTRSIYITYVIYILIAIAGFLSVPFNMPDLIIYRTTIFSNDLFMTVAKIGMSFTLLMGIPPTFNAFRLSIFELVWDSKNINNFKNVIVTLPTICVAVLVAIVYDKVLSYLSILGGFCSVVICFLIPGVLYLKTNEFERYHWKNIVTFILTGILSVIGITAGIKTIVDI